MTQEEILLATLTTDENGECTYTYTGTGAGKIDLIAKYRGLQSETYSIIDGIFKDIAVTGKKSNYWLYQSAWTITPDTTGTTVTELNNASSSPLLVSTIENAGLWSQARTFTTDIAVELDISNIANYPRFIIYANNDATTISKVFEVEGHYKFTIGSNGVYCSIDDGTPVQVSSVSISNAKLGFGDTAASTLGSFKYAKFVVYPI